MTWRRPAAATPPPYVTVTLQIDYDVAAQTDPESVTGCSATEIVRCYQLSKSRTWYRFDFRSV